MNFALKIEAMHIGMLIEAKMTDIGMNNSEFARRLQYARKEINISKADSLMKESKSQKTWGVFGLVIGPLFITTGAISIAVADASTTPALNKAFGGIFISLGAVEVILGSVLIAKSKKNAEAAQKLKGYATWGSPNIQLYSDNSGGTGLMLSTKFKF